ncbi:MAG TPA: SRPBCC family protein, partial [Cryptosporangiaceae bacterium]|nr:SRPBCC family protein [Cryptosporangiaceae bacterium]
GRMGEWSPETTSCRWLDGATGPQVGARFVGTNAYLKRRWRTVCTVTESERGRVFAFAVRSGILPVATWRYEFVPSGDGCEVTESTEDLRGRFLRWYGHRVLRVRDRRPHNETNMAETLRRLKSAAEAPSRAG